MGLHHRPLAVLILVAAFASAAPPTSAEEAPVVPPGHADNPVLIELPDSLRTSYTSSSDAPLEMAPIEVRARRITRRIAADRIRLSSGTLRARDGATVADLAALLPSTQLNNNSRGESLFLVRGSSERHLAVELDGVPLTIPWDERSDLSMLPLIGVGEVIAQRGVASVLDAPNALAGVIRLQSRERDRPGTHTRLGLERGEVESYGARFLHERLDGDWRTTLALESRDRAGVLVPKSYEPGVHQGTRRLRLNSDLRQNSLLFRAARRSAARFDFGAFVQASEGEKGVAPEDHLTDARFWRYPRHDRVLAAAHATIDSTADSPWSLESVLSWDWFEQEIRPYDDATYTGPPLVAGEPFEIDHDRTTLARLSGARYFDSKVLRTRALLRRARHRESLEVDGPELDYGQNLGALGAELQWALSRDWTLRGGAGWETASTPLTGDKPSRATDHEWSAQLAVEHRPKDRWSWHASVSRRPRFPSLREMFSGALGRFQDNPDLRPERQSSVELGGRIASRRVDVMANLFAQLLDGAIERVGIPATALRQRVNLGEVLHAGAELGVLLRPTRGLTLDWQHTVLHSRRKVGSSFDGRVEDRPEWLSTLALDYVHPSGFSLRFEGEGLGPRYSFDDRRTTETERLTRLDTDLRANLRLSYRRFSTRSWLEGGELFIRVDNLFDSVDFSQLGLPRAGRQARIGLRIDLRS